MGSDTEIRIPDNTIAFDGVCNFCNFWVNKLLDWDKRKRLSFVSLQLLEETGVISSQTPKIDSIIFFSGGRRFHRSDAILEICGLLGFPFSLIGVFRIIPKAFRDPAYDLVARNRYRWFGKKESCRIPTAEERARFLDSSLLASFAAEINKPG